MARISARISIPLLTSLCTSICGFALAAEVPCTDHKMLSTPRPESSCEFVKPHIYPSPDGAIRALVFATDVDLYATPDMESRVVFRSNAGKLLNSKDYSSPRGTDGYYVVSAHWSPDSQFFVFSMSSSGGHSPWSFPMWVFSRKANVIVDFSQMIGGNPILSADFKFVGPYTINATTWDKPGSLNKVPVTVDLPSAMEKVPAPSQ